MENRSRLPGCILLVVIVVGLGILGGSCAHWLFYG